MAKFQVTLLERVKYLVEIEADSEEEAEQAAIEAWGASENPSEEFDADGYGVECTHVTEG